MSRASLSVASRTFSRPSSSVSSRIWGTIAAAALSSAARWASSWGPPGGRNRLSMSRSEPRTCTPAYAAVAAITDVPLRASGVPSGGQQRASGQQYEK